MANTKNQRVKQQFRRQTELTYRSPLRGVYVRNALEHSQGVLATGRYHFSVWFGGRQITTPFISTDKGYYTKVTPGPNEVYLQFVFLIQPADDECTLQVCGETSDEKEIIAGYTDVGLLALQEIVFTYQATAGTETDIWFNVDADYVVRGMTVRDLPKEALTSEDYGYYDLSNYYAGKPISAEIVQKVVQCQEYVLEDIRKVHINQAPLKDDEPLLSCTPTASWANLLDLSEADYDANSPGFWIRPGAAYLGNRHVKLKCRVKAASASGTAVLRFIGSDSQYSDEIAVTSGTAAWYTAYFFVQTPYSYQAEYAEKIDIQCKDSGTMNLDVYNILVEELDTGITSVDCFRALDTDSILPSAENLPAVLTINGTTVYPSARYRGVDATVSSWPAWGYGETLTIAGSGDDPTPNDGSPLLGANDDSVCFSGGKYYVGPDNDYLNAGTQDIVIEGIFRPKYDGSIRHSISNWISPLGYMIYISSAGTTLHYIGNGTTTKHISISIPAGATYHFLWAIDRSGSMRAYVNGSIAGTIDITAVVGSMSNSSYPFVIGANSNGARLSISGFEYFAIYMGQDWLDTHEQDDLAKERFSRLCGVYPQIARGTAVPLVCSRASVAMLRKYESGSTRLYRVEENWPRIEHVKDGSDNDFKGYLSEPEAENICLQSEDMSTTWAKVNAGDTIDSDAAAGPDGEIALDGIIADATDTQHGFSQPMTLTAASWVFSKFFEVGDRDWGYLDVSTIANAYAYFDLATGAIGTTGAAATAGIEDYGDGLYRCWITYTGTVAAHTHRSLAADADGDNSIVGDASTTNIYQGYAQVELGIYPTSYIKTTTAAATRAADRLYYDGDDGNAGDEHGTIECTVLAHDAAPASVRNLVTLSAAGSADNKISYRLNTSQQAEVYVRDAAADQVSSAGSTDACDDEDHIHRLRYKVNSVWSLLDGSQEISEDDSCTIPTIDRIDIGADEGGDSQAGPDVWIKKVRAKRISTSH